MSLRGPTDDRCREGWFRPVLRGRRGSPRFCRRVSEQPWQYLNDRSLSNAFIREEATLYRVLLWSAQESSPYSCVDRPYMVHRLVGEQEALSLRSHRRIVP